MTSKAQTHAHTTHETLLTLDAVSVSYHQPVLNKISATVKNIKREGKTQGQVIGLLGPSGIGKTQLFRCIAGLQKPTSGAVRLNGGKQEVRPGDVGVVAQNYPLFNHRTVLGNLMLAASKTSKTKAEAQSKAYAMLDDFKLADKAHSYPHSLSGGQRQRIAIAQQLLCSSYFMLMDEPFSGLDPLAKDRVCETINRAASSHDLNTFIVITHDIESALAISDTLWVLGRDSDKKGEKIPGASLKQIYNLAEMGMAWTPDLTSRPEFFELSNQIKRQFATL